MSTAYFLVAHGSRDRRLSISLSQLRQNFLKAAPPSSGGGLSVATGTLEFGPAPLAQQLCDFGQQVVAADVGHLEILPLFLQTGVHVREDIPAAIAAAQSSLPQSLTVKTHPPLGSHPALAPALAHILGQHTVDAWVLMAHGSRRPGGNAPVEQMAQTLGLSTAYWSVAPSLQQTLQHLLDQGHRRIGILPYFLFPGKITDQIANWVTELTCQNRQTNPDLDLVLLSPLGMGLAIASLLWGWPGLRIS